SRWCQAQRPCARSPADKSAIHPGVQPDPSPHNTRVLREFNNQEISALAFPQKQPVLIGVASRVMCKSGERVTGPVLVHTFKDAQEDSFATAASSEGTQGPDADAHCHAESFDPVGGA